MIGAGAVATRLLAGAWFGFDLLWVALYVVPMVVFTLDSASRVGVLSGGRGMFEMIRTDIGAWLAWVIFLPTVLVNIVVNMSQMSAMVEGAYGAMGMLPPAGGEATLGLCVVTIVLTGVTRRRGGARRLQARREDHDRAAARHPRRASSSSRSRGCWTGGPGWRSARGLVPQIPRRRAGRRAPTAPGRLHADHGDRRPGAAAGGVAVATAISPPTPATPTARRPSARSGRRCRTSA